MEPVVSPIRQREARPRFITSLYQDMDLKTLAIEKEGGLMFRHSQRGTWSYRKRVVVPPSWLGIHR